MWQILISMTTKYAVKYWLTAVCETSPENALITTCIFDSFSSALFITYVHTGESNAVNVAITDMKRVL